MKKEDEIVKKRSSQDVDSGRLTFVQYCSQLPNENHRMWRDSICSTWTAFSHHDTLPRTLDLCPSEGEERQFVEIGSMSNTVTNLIIFQDVIRDFWSIISSSYPFQRQGILQPTTEQFRWTWSIRFALLSCEWHWIGVFTFAGVNTGTHSSNRKERMLHSWPLSSLLTSNDIPWLV